MEVSPYIVASQSIPIVAIAPLLVIWLGPGIFSKILTSALIVFFPVLVNTIVGLRSVPEELYELMESLQASTWQRITKLEIPAALPVFLGGLRIGATLAVIGEYDTDWFNYGLRAAPDRSWRVDLTLTDSRAIGGAVSYLGIFP